MAAKAQIRALNVYPVKSCRGIASESLRLATTGFEGDRHWLVVRPPPRFVTQREPPRLARPLPMERFRPNIVLDGLNPYDEDRIAELHGDGVCLRVVKSCTRCSITTTNQATGEVEGDEPLRTLKSYRYSKSLKGVMFGQNAIVVEGAGRRLEVGGELDIIWRE